MGELGRTGCIEQAARPVPVLAMCAPNLALELARFAPDRRPVTELVGGTAPLQQPEAVADGRIDAIRTDNEVGPPPASIREAQRALRIRRNSPRAAHDLAPSHDPSRLDHP